MRPLRCSRRSWVPGQVEMEKVAAMPLEVQAFARGVGSDQDAERMVVGRGVEGPLDVLSTVGRGRTAEDCDPILGTLCMHDGLAQQALQPAPRVLVFGKDQHAAFRPDLPALLKARHHFPFNPVSQMADPRIRTAAIGLSNASHLLDRIEFGLDLRLPPITCAT